jgi:OOP family OmpA-OmpF porin
MKKIIATAVLSAFAAPAFAGSIDMTNFYAGVTLGVGNANFTAPAASTVVIDNPKSKPVYGALLGYRYNKNLAVEVAYTGASYFNTTTALGAKYLSKQIVFAVTAVGTYPVTDAFSVYGKLGVARASSENNAVAEQNTTRIGATYGVGAEYKFTPNIAARFGVDRYAVTATIPTVVPATQQNSNATTVNAGLIYSF